MRHKLHREAVLAFTFYIIILCGLAGCARSSGIAQRTPERAANLMTARAGFKTHLTRNITVTDGTAPIPPPTIFKAVRYPSPIGPLFAYLSPDPGDRKKHPAIVWAHGGFGGIDNWLWKKDDQQDPGHFREADIIVMCPSWRAENDNPGRFELFYGEVEDAVAAINYLSKVPYVDPSRIYIAGHSTGGTITLLAAEATNKLRAAFSFGGCPDLGHLLRASHGKGYGNTPFDYQDRQESRLRSPLFFVAGLRVPTFYFEGAESFYPEDALRMQEGARHAGVPFSAYIVEGGNHFTILQPLTALVAQKILADTGPTCNIRFRQKEVDQAFTEGKTP